MTETTELTGAEVERRRKALGLSRRVLADRCGFPSEVRIMNIERKDSWKPGNRDVVARALAELEAAPPARPRGRSSRASAEARVDRLMGALEANGHALHLLGPEDDDDEDPPGGGFTVLPDEPTEAAVPPALIDWGDDRDDLPGGFFVLGDEYDDDDDEVAATEGATPSVDHLGGGKLLTNSEVAAWQRCRRKWWLTFYRRLVSGQVDYFGAREIGNRVHRALEAYYRDGGDPRVALEAAIAADWEALREQTAARGADVDVADLLAQLGGRFQDATQLERAMVEGYVEWLTETGADANYRVVDAEAIVSAPLVGTAAGEPVAVTALGKMDARLERLSDGARLFMDHKTADQFAPAVKTLHLDPQMLHYHLLEWLTSGEGEARCEGALYNMLRKVKRSASAKPPFFQRVEQRHNTHEVESYRRRLLGAARDILRATRELDAGHDHREVVYPNPTKSCSWDCDFFLVCPMFDDGSRVEDALRNLYHVGDPLQRYARDQEGLGI